MGTRMSAAVAALLGVIGAGGQAHSQEAYFSLTGQQIIEQDNSYFVLSEDDHSFGANLALGLEVWDNLAVFAEYEGATEQDLMLGGSSGEFDIYGARLGVKYAYPLLSFLEPYASVGVAAHWGDLDWTGTSGLVYDDTAFGVGVRVSGGYEVLLRLGDETDEAKVTLWDRLTLGILNDYGWTFGPNLHFDELAPEDGEAGGATPIDLGETSLGGFTWRLGLLVKVEL